MSFPDRIVIGAPAPPTRPTLRGIPGGHAPATGPILTEHERQWLASLDATVIAANSRADADAGIPMLTPVDLDGPPPDTTELGEKWAAVNAKFEGRS